MKKIVFLSFALFSILCHAQNIIEVNGKGITVDQFKSVYGKNIKIEGKDKAVEAYIRSQLLLAEAKKLGLDTAAKTEYMVMTRLYPQRNDFLGIKDLKNKLIEQSFQRLQKEREVNIIIVPIRNIFSPADTLAAYKKANTLYKSLKSRATSIDKLKKENKSQDYSITAQPVSVGAFVADYETEDIVYNTPIGEVSAPVRAGGKYMMVEVLKEKPMAGTFHLSHIQIKDEGDGAKKIQEVYTKLTRGEKFENLVNQYSQNTVTKEKEGRLPPLEGSLKPEMLAVINSLKINEYSKPVKLDDGWHIFMLKGKKPICINLSACKQEIEERLLTSDRVVVMDRAVVKEGKKNMNYIFDKKALDEVLNKIPAQYLTNKKDSLKFNGDKEILKVGEATYNQKELVKTLNQAQKVFTPDTDIRFFSSQLINEIQDKMILDELINNLEGHNTSYKEMKTFLTSEYITNEYIEGYVFPEAAQDEKGMKLYLKENQKKYTWPERVEMDRFICASKETAEKVKSYIEAKKPTELILKELNKPNTTQKEVFLQTGKVNINSGKLPYGMKIEKGVQLLKEGDKYNVIDVKQVIPPTAMTYEEAREVLYNDYKNVFLEKKLNKLKEKTQIKIDKKELDKITVD